MCDRHDLSQSTLFRGPPENVLPGTNQRKLENKFTTPSKLAVVIIFADLQQ